MAPSYQSKSPRGAKACRTLTNISKTSSGNTTIVIEAGAPYDMLHDVCPIKKVVPCFLTAFHHAAFSVYVGPCGPCYVSTLQDSKEGVLMLWWPHCIRIKIDEFKPKLATR
eukprot:6301682-Amphidinium_carterae.1